LLAMPACRNIIFLHYCRMVIISVISPIIDAGLLSPSLPLSRLRWRLFSAASRVDAPCQLPLRRLSFHCRLPFSRHYFRDERDGGRCERQYAYSGDAAYAFAAPHLALFSLPFRCAIEKGAQMPSARFRAGAIHTLLFRECCLRRAQKKKKKKKKKKKRQVERGVSRCESRCSSE